MSTTATNIEAVARQNQKLGNFPTVTLKDGSKVPTGTVATLLYNIRLYDALKAKATSSKEDEAEMRKLEGEMEAAIPILGEAGMWDLFQPHEWIAEGTSGVSEGRRFVGRRALAKQEEERKAAS